jgi:transposase
MYAQEWQARATLRRSRAEGWITPVSLETVGSGKDDGMAAARKYPVELKERAVGMVRELERELGEGRGAIARVAGQLGVHPEALRYWVRQDDKGKRPSGERVSGSEPDKDARIAELERELRETRRANEILRLASAFFAREVDLQPPR